MGPQIFLGSHHISDWVREVEPDTGVSDDWDYLQNKQSKRKQNQNISQTNEPSRRKLPKSQAGEGGARGSPKWNLSLACPGELWGLNSTTNVCTLKANKLTFWPLIQAWVIGSGQGRRVREGSSFSSPPGRIFQRRRSLWAVSSLHALQLRHTCPGLLTRAAGGTHGAFYPPRGGQIQAFSGEAFACLNASPRQPRARDLTANRKRSLCGAEQPCPVERKQGPHLWLKNVSGPLGEGKQNR